MLIMDGGGSQGQLSVCFECQGSREAISHGKHKKKYYGERQGQHSPGGSNIKALASLTRVMDLLMSLITSFVSASLVPSSVLRHIIGAVFEEQDLAFKYRCGYCRHVVTAEPGEVRG